VYGWLSCRWLASRQCSAFTAVGLCFQVDVVSAEYLVKTLYCYTDFLRSKITDTARLVCEAGSMKRPSVLLSVCPGPILSVFPALIVHSELKSVHPGFPVVFIF